MSILYISWYILGETAVYILFGFAVAGLLQAFISSERATQWLSRRKRGSVFLATLVGAPLPLCSCSVLPAALTLRKKGAGRGATLSFLISTPETSVTSILITYSLLGPLMAIFRPVAAVITALAAGFAENFLDRKPADQSTNEATKNGGIECDPESCVCGAPENDDAAQRPAEKLAAGMRFAFIELFDDIFGWIAFGILAAALIQILLPTEAFSEYFGNPWIAMPVMLLISIPLYVCAEGSTPIAAVLLTQGLNPGAALVLLLAGPATNIGAVGALARVLGRRAVIVYLTTIAIVSLLMGVALNWLLGMESLTLNVRLFQEPLLPMWLKAMGAVAFLAMGLLTMQRREWLKRLAARLDAWLPFGVTKARLSGAAIVIAVIGYFGSGFFAVQPGESGVVLRFGKITRSDLTPGLHYAWPAPFEKSDRIAIRRVNRLVLGYPQYMTEAGELIPNEADSWMLIGDENIAEIKSVVHWSAKPDEALRFKYGNEDPEKLVGDVALGAMREVLGGRTINHGFTTERFDCEQAIEKLIQQRLDTYESGIGIESFRFLDAHAPADVHDSFRDVAGALEDKSTQINLALAQEARVVPLARGEGERLEAEAGGYAADAKARATGEAERFTMTWEAYREAPRVTRWRLYIETMERALRDIRTYLKPGGSKSRDIEIWLTDPQTGTGLPWQPDDAAR